LIAVIASIGGIDALVGSGAYGISKVAALRLARHRSPSWAPAEYGSCDRPGCIDTDMIKLHGIHNGIAGERDPARSSTRPYTARPRPPGTPSTPLKKVARVALFLTVDLAAVVT
jgi:NAD(P)-dependent dehydrogenase (short-subunit alcohol dehydrogenase family)